MGLGFKVCVVCFIGSSLVCRGRGEIGGYVGIDLVWFCILFDKVVGV